MGSDRGRQALITVFGLSAGVAAGLGVWLWKRRDRIRRSVRPPGRAPHRGSAQDIIRALRGDPRLSRRSIEVDTIAEGVIELSGRVADRAEAERATDIAQATTGVYTVVNRLTVDAEERARETTRRRWQEGAPDLRERQHYGMGVGMGTRRQSPSTDPDRPSDKQRRIERELDVNRVAREADRPLPDAEAEQRGVEREPMKPGDVRALEQTGLSPDGGPPEAREPGKVDTGESADAEEERG